jgi:cbb3-type cytochrome oxidase maturation protein
MSIVFLLIPLGIVLMAASVVALFWAVDSGQYDGELEQEGRRILDGESDQEVTTRWSPRPPTSDR